MNTDTGQSVPIVASSSSSENPTAQQKRAALVIGNTEYKNAPLQNPLNDAFDMSETLRSLGFQVILKTNVNQQEMETAINEFIRQIQDGDVALFYFSGHGSQIDGQNYLIPVDENIQSASDMRYKAVNVGFLLGKMEESMNETNIIVLDACRDNPFKGFKSQNRGFAPMVAPRGTFIAYATAPGAVAWEDATARNSIYTAHLLKEMPQEGVILEQTFKQVLRGVENATNGRQTPWVESSLRGDFYFRP